MELDSKKMEELLKQGILVQDPEDEGKVIYHVPIHIKKEVILAGGFEAFASSSGWTKLIEKDGELIPNPVSSFEACNKIVWDFIKGIFKEIMLTKMREQAEKDVQAKVKELL